MVWYSYRDIRQISGYHLTKAHKQNINLREHFLSQKHWNSWFYSIQKDVSERSVVGFN